MLFSLLVQVFFITREQDTHASMLVHAASASSKEKGIDCSSAPPVIDRKAHFKVGAILAIRKGKTT